MSKNNETEVDTAPSQWRSQCLVARIQRDQWIAIATRLAQYVEPKIWQGSDANDAMEQFMNLSEIALNLPSAIGMAAGADGSPLPAKEKTCPLAITDLFSVFPNYQPT